MAWEVLNDKAQRRAKRGKEGCWISFPGRGKAAVKCGGRYATLSLDKAIPGEMRWELGDSMICMIDRESRLLAVKRDPKNGPTVLTHSNGSHSKQDKKISRYRLSVPKETSLALEAMFGIDCETGSESIELEHIIDGSMVVFSRRTTNDAT